MEQNNYGCLEGLTRSNYLTSDFFILPQMQLWNQNDIMRCENIIASEDIILLLTFCRGDVCTCMVAHQGWGCTYLCLYPYPFPNSPSHTCICIPAAAKLFGCALELGVNVSMLTSLGNYWTNWTSNGRGEEAPHGSKGIDGKFGAIPFVNGVGMCPDWTTRGSRWWAQQGSNWLAMAMVK